MRDYREPVDKVRENKARCWATRLGFALHRSRAKQLHYNNRGLYQLVNFSNHVKLGADFDATLEDVEEFLQRQEDELRS